LTLLPLVSVLFKVLARFGINLRPTDKMLFGFIFTAMAAGTFVTVDLLPGDEKHSLLWIIFAFIFLTIGEILISPVGLELAFVAAPKSMKSFVTACFLLTSSIASYANGLITPLYSKTTEGVRLFTPTQYFGAQVLMALAAMVALYFVAKPFNKRLAEQTNSTI
jgi:POT family proton-dependent oligopeptide transporter